MRIPLGEGVRNWLGGLGCDVLPSDYQLTVSRCIEDVEQTWLAIKDYLLPIAVLDCLANLWSVRGISAT